MLPSEGPWERDHTARKVDRVSRMCSNQWTWLHRVSRSTGSSVSEWCSQPRSGSPDFGRFKLTILAVNSKALLDRCCQISRNGRHGNSSQCASGHQDWQPLGQGQERSHGQRNKYRSRTTTGQFPRSQSTFFSASPALYILRTDPISQTNESTWRRRLVL